MASEQSYTVSWWTTARGRTRILNAATHVPLDDDEHDGSDNLHLTTKGGTISATENLTLTEKQKMKSRAVQE